MAEALAEAGATVYCLDLPFEPDNTFRAAQSYVSKLRQAGNTRLEYTSVDVTNQVEVWNAVENIVKREGRLDTCVAAAGIRVAEDCLAHSAEEFQKLMDVNVNGAFYTAQAAGRQMVKFGNPGSIIVIASKRLTILCVQGQNNIAYNTSKAAVIQMGRSLACELGLQNIRVNTISPGYIHTQLTATVIGDQPHFLEQWKSESPLGRMGRPHELRGVAVWLASDASSFVTGSDILVSGGSHAWHYKCI
ncbi:NAD-binding protein [Fomitiporia mediterranea MF3/22]|uniref:NAD-binding protein n=1 Tax=Fomitiporia mediterranea (strain MF3/22) TaxID=694068 RepID=UPI0004409234|nr:NAD-binding protein [Fomitiporia mediterranea MF3/22]EJC99852.1 NAD-binding protein [Fomitiporia mediterranea MF3/22]